MPATACSGANAAAAKDGDHDLDRREGCRRGGAAHKEKGHGVPVTDEHLGVGLGGADEPLLGRRGRVVDTQVDLSHDRLDDGVQERRLVRQVVVDGHGVHAELGPQTAHREGVQPIGIHQGEGGVHDALAGQRLSGLGLGGHERIPSGDDLTPTFYAVES